QPERRETPAPACKSRCRKSLSSRLSREKRWKRGSTSRLITNDRAAPPCFLLTGRQKTKPTDPLRFSRIPPAPTDRLAADRQSPTAINPYTTAPIATVHGGTRDASRPATHD